VAAVSSPERPPAQTAQAAHQARPPRSAVTLPAPPGWGAVLRARLKRLLAPAVVLGIWQCISLYVLDETTRALLPPPTAVAATFFEMIRSGELFRHLFDSLRREFTAFSWAIVAIPLGVAMGWWKPVHEQMNALVEMLRPIPPLAWIPLSILWFGVGNTQNQFIILLGIFFPILLNTIAGVKSVEPNLVRAARCLGGGEAAVLRRVVLPAALPQIVTGVRIGLGVGWMALVAAELVGANSGLGFLINDARTLLRTDIVIVGMITIGLVGLGLDIAVRALSRRLLPWSRAMQG
jgi:ABC-type nitrate/sulfonate/bicarbonate transport system permease component